MKKILLLLIMTPVLLAFQCDEDCLITENWEQNSYVPLVTITPIQSSYSAGDKITLTASLPATNEYFGEPVNILEESGDETGLLQLIAVEGQGDLFQDNQVTLKKGSQGRYSTLFEMPFNSETGNYELEVEITLNRTGSYIMLAEASVDFGSSDCPDYRVNVLFSGVEEQFLEFSVGE